MAFWADNKILKTVIQINAITMIAVILGLGANHFRDNAIPFIGDWTPETRIQDEAGGSMTVSLAEAGQLFQNKSAFFLDARPQSAYEEGHIRGARCLPWLNVDDRFTDVTADLNSDDPIITYCDGETCTLGEDLAFFLRDMGFTNVRVLVNGWTRWRGAGLPEEAETGTMNQ